ncbi:hypothetical protein [Hymenobacter sp.]|uniref:hypothetical protein n=1 Tax=Hymenobacter sp. TaxID=1898978 RepID=UPI00286B5138|nr:hypothetical protein [Hymenobacter sp.]
MGQLIATAHPWQKIEGTYISLNEYGWKHDHMLALVRHIQATNLSRRLFAVTSLDNLVVSGYIPFEFGHETLHIRFDRTNQAFLFDYCLRHLREPEFHRVYPAELGIKKFDQFIKWIGW